LLPSCFLVLGLEEPTGTPRAASNEASSIDAGAIDGGPEGGDDGGLTNGSPTDTMSDADDVFTSVDANGLPEAGACTILNVNTAICRCKDNTIECPAKIYCSVYPEDDRTIGCTASCDSAQTTVACMFGVCKLSGTQVCASCVEQLPSSPSSAATGKCR
jgi:hypothetical protein